MRFLPYIFRRQAGFPSEDARYAPAIMMASARKNVAPGMSRKIASDSPAPMNGASA